MESKEKSAGFSEAGFVPKMTTGDRIRMGDPIDLRLDILRQRADRGEHLFYDDEIVKSVPTQKWTRLYEAIGRINKEVYPVSTRSSE